MTPNDRIPDDIPLTVMISTDARTLGVVSVFDDVAAMKAIRVSRGNLLSIPEKWKNGRGFYLLLSDVSKGKYQAYVGTATQSDFLSSISSHCHEEDSWTHVFLFQRDTTNGLNSAQTFYIETAISRILKKCSWITVTNNQITEDKTLANHEAFYMDQVVKSALRVLNIFGYEIASAEDHGYKHSSEPTVEKSTFTHYGVTIEDLVACGLLKNGEMVVSLYKSYPGSGVVGAKGIVLDDEESTPSKTAGKVRNIHNKDLSPSTNGWTFWGVERDDAWVALSEIRDQYLSSLKLHEESLLTEKGVDFDEAVQENELNKEEASVTLEFDPEEFLPESEEVLEVSDEAIEVSVEVPEAEEADTLVKEISSADESHDSLDEVLNVKEIFGAEEEPEVPEDPQKDSDPNRHIDSRIRVSQLVDAGYLDEGMVLVSTDATYPVEGATIRNGGISVNGNVHPSPTVASKYARRIFEDSASATNGWEFWAVQKANGTTFTLSEILDQYLEKDKL